MSKPVKDLAITKLIQLIKSTFVKKADVTVTTVIDVDSTPTSNSTNLVTSGGVKAALDTICGGKKLIFNDDKTVTWENA